MKFSDAHFTSVLSPYTNDVICVHTTFTQQYYVFPVVKV